MLEPTHRDLLDSLPGADTCPFHDLPPEMTVWITAGGMALPYSAEYACISYHDAIIIESIVEQVRAAAADGPLLPGGPIA
jgi:hypothetical protein